MSSETSYPFSPHYSRIDPIEPGGPLFQSGTSPRTSNQLHSFQLSTDDINSSSSEYKLKEETPTPVNILDFSLSPVYAPSGILHTPTSMIVPTPRIMQGSFQASPNIPFEPSGQSADMNPATGIYPTGIQLNSVVQPHVEQTQFPSEPHYDQHERFSASMISTGEVFIKNEEHNKVNGLTSSLTECANVPLYKPKEDGITIEQFLMEDPFKSMEGITEVQDPLIKVEDTDLASTLTDLLEREERSRTTSPKDAMRIIKNNFHEFNRSREEGRTGLFSRVIRKTKSFSAAVLKTSKEFSLPNFTFEDCASEFHVLEGNYSFEDETAKVSKQCDLGIGTPISKKKSASKLNKPPSMLRKSKTTSNLCMQYSCRSKPKVLKNMESGLFSFQLQVKNTENNQG